MNYLNNDFDLRKYIAVADELPVWSAPFGLKLLDHIDYKPDISALDIGFGTGFPLTELAMRLGNNAKVYGIDPDTDTNAHARRKIDFYRITNVQIFEQPAESIPLDDDSIDLVVSNNGINNVRDIDQVVAQCGRVMKTGGQFVLTMNLETSMFEFYEHLEEVLSELNMHEEIEYMYKHIREKRPPLDDMISVLNRHGFLIKDLEHDQFNYRFSNASAMLNHYFIRIAFMDSWISILPKNKTGMIFQEIENRLNVQSQLLGGLKLSIPFVLINAVLRT